jgi:ubiquinone/menaquinone biosynthesis C-methylase UbiE
METVEQNERYWGASYDWPLDGDEWSVPWGGTQNLWQYVIFPRIQKYLPAMTIVEIAAGFGRWTQFLQKYCNHLIAVDLAPRCVERCALRFADLHHVQPIQNDGRTIPVADDASVDFVFSFDSLVHAEANILHSYLQEIARVLKPTGAAFLHHSNLAMYRPLLNASNKLPQLAKRAGRRLYILPKPHLRSESVSAALVSSKSHQLGLFPVRQELINWNNGPFLIDCLTTLTRCSAIPARTIKNRYFMREAERIRLSHIAT